MRTAAFVSSVTGALLLAAGCGGEETFREDPVGPPGVQALRRLNRVEHANTLDDLLTISSGAVTQLPDDPVAHGFDTVAEGLILTPVYAEFYERVTDTALDKFFGNGIGNPSPALEQVVPCDIDTDDVACMTTVATAFLPQAWRRPATEDDISWAVARYEAARTLGSDPREALQVAMKAILMAPEFIFRVETTPGAGEVASLDAHEVATRLAYFLWSSTPDQALLDAATSGTLLAEGGIAAQVERMLQDPRADALLENFGGQWLDVRRVSEVQPNIDVHPFFNDSLKASMQAEMLRMAEPFLRGEEAFDVVLTAERSYIERRLAQHYSMLHNPAPDGLTDVPEGRMGLLTTGGWLSMTSHPDEASAVRRGHWVLQKLLCDPPPPPPPDVEGTVAIAPDSGSVREQEEAVRQSAACRSCHGEMDPIGYVLHGYDAVGIGRDSDRLGYPIDSVASLDGQRVGSVPELVDWLLTDERLSRCIVEQTFTYALGRTPEDGDAQVIDQVTQAFVDGGRRFPVLIENLVVSTSFLDVTGGPDAIEEAP